MDPSRAVVDLTKDEDQPRTTAPKIDIIDLTVDIDATEEPQLDGMVAISPPQGPAARVCDHTRVEGGSCQPPQGVGASEGASGSRRKRQRSFSLQEDPHPNVMVFALETSEDAGSLAVGCVVVEMNLQEKSMRLIQIIRVDNREVAKTQVPGVVEKAMSSGQKVMVLHRKVYGVPTVFKLTGPGGDARFGAQFMAKDSPVKKELLQLWNTARDVKKHQMRSKQLARVPDYLAGQEREQRILKEAMGLMNEDLHKYERHKYEPFKNDVVVGRALLMCEYEREKNIDKLGKKLGMKTCVLP